MKSQYFNNFEFYLYTDKITYSSPFANITYVTTESSHVESFSALQTAAQ